MDASTPTSQPQAQPVTTPSQADSPAAQDPARIASLIARVRAEQNINGALSGGTLGALLGAVLWAILTVITKFEIGWEAIGVGFLVGYGVRRFGKGVDPVFGYIGGALSAIGIAFGNILTGMIAVSTTQNIPFMDLLTRMNFNAAWILLTAGFSPIDILFYALGIYYGYRFSFRRLTQADLVNAT